MPQKLHRGDVVRIADDLGPERRHFEKSRDAVILGSYRDQYGGSAYGEDHYTVMFLDTGGECSWYYDCHLTLLRHGGESEIAGCIEARKQREAIERDLEWIVASWPRIRQSPSGATMSALMTAIGIDNPWGSNGEGITYYTNMYQTAYALDEALMTGNVAKVRERIAEVRRAVKGAAA